MWLVMQLVMQLRAYCSTDFEDVIHLWWASWHSSSGYAHHRPMADWKQRWRDLEKTHEIVVIDHLGQLVAFAAVNTQTCVLSQLFVAPQWKRRANADGI